MRCGGVFSMCMPQTATTTAEQCCQCITHTNRRVTSFVCYRISHLATHTILMITAIIIYSLMRIMIIL